jgi:hypothetical protein
MQYGKDPPRVPSVGDGRAETWQASDDAVLALAGSLKFLSSSVHQLRYENHHVFMG